MKHRRLNGRFALSGLALATACLWGLNAQALGLGRLTVQSALGEPLRAEIDITSMTPEEAGTLALRVATPEAYRAAGVDYNAVLPGTQVQLLKRPDGRPFVRVTSDRAVVEPFLDVILELNWASGRLVRDFTLLLDPPATPRNLAAAPASVAPAISAAPPVQPRVAQTAPVAPLAPAPERRAAPRPETPAPAPRAAAPVPAAPLSSAGGEQYRVRPGDSLSKIARNVQPQNVSLDQMLVALFRGNPDAFIANNMNLLKAGEVLKVPSADAARQVSAPEAREVIRAQSADFSAYRQQLASGVSTQPTEAPARQAKGSVQASVEETKAAAAPAPDKLTLSQGAVKPSAAAEAAASREAEKTDAATRVAELSRNVEDLKRLQGETAGAAAAPAADAQTAVASPAAQPAAGESASVQAAASAPAVAMVPAAPVTAAPAAAPKAPAPAAPEASVVDSLLDNPMLLPAGGLLVALLAGFGFYRLRGRLRKGERETSFLESRLQPDSFFGASGGQRIDTHDAPSANSSASSMSYSLSQLDAIGDVDPVAEADVYLAYGRDLQAEEILKEAMRANPERLAVRSKLLEVYAKRRDTKGFELLAGQLFALTGADHDEWRKAQELGRQIDADNPLYAPGGKPDLLVREGGRVVEPLDATTMPQSAQPKAPVGPITEAGSLDLPPNVDLELDVELDGRTRSDSTLGALEATRPFTTGASIAADAPLSVELPGSRKPAASAAAPASLDALDFDLGELTLDDDKPAASRPAPLSAADEFSASLPSLELGDEDADPLVRKLELAEEFRRIGDMEGARDLLEEVVAGAGGALKTKAQGMLDSLS
ncbi:MAG TPA: FimV/HubP family polar landmark protein [Rubrivivax sp.]|nr:FimV/HubP family polar landmark protein [Rubrivivax sp.]